MLEEHPGPDRPVVPGRQGSPGILESVELHRDFAIDSGFTPAALAQEATQFGAFAADGGERLYAHDWGSSRDPADPLHERRRPRSRVPQVPGYEILGEVGRGGMGIVYKARQLRLNRTVALKMILAGDHAGADARARLVAEAETIARLQHPNVVQVYAIGDYEDRPYVELELVEGGSLATQLDGTPRPPRDAAGLVEILARAVAAAHRLGIVHRDLKPANILMTPEGQPKISDFGLAKQLERPARLTRSEAIVGSPSYMAPEQAEGLSAKVGPPVDIYALGANLYELITGRPPFVAPSLLATLELVRSVDPVSPRRLQPTLARDLETICLKCLEKDPERRYESAEALADDLARYLRGEPILARPTGWAERIVKWVRRRPTAAALIAVSGLAIAGTLGGGFAYRAELTRRADASRRRFESVKKQADDLILLGRESLRHRDWHEARTQLNSALAVLRSEPRLAGAQTLARSLVATAEQQMALESHRATAQARWTEFHRLHDEAVFYQSEYTGLDAEASLRASRDAARRGLSQFGLDPDDTGHVTPDLDGLEPTQQAAVRIQGYELTLILAEAIAQPLAEEDPVRQARAALRILEQARRLRTPSPIYHRLRAGYLDTLGERAAAAAAQREADRLPESARSPADDFLAGEQTYRARDYAQAIGRFQRTLVHQPDHFWAQYLLAVCHLKSHRAAQAQASLVACQSRRPTFVWTYLLKGFAEGEMGEFDLAEEDFRRAEMLGLGNEGRYVMLVNRGVMRIRRGHHREAADDLAAAVALKPDQFPAFVNLAEAYERLGLRDRALATLNLALKEAPREAVLYRARSRIERLRGDVAAALADLGQAIALSRAGDPALAGDYLEEGLLLQQAGRLEEALAACERAATLDPKRPEVHRLRAVVLVALKRYEEAIRSFDLCMAQGGTSAALHEARGLALFWGGSHDRAIADFTVALGLGHPTAGLLANRGWAYLASGAAEPALRDFDAALGMEPTHGHALGGRALAYIQLRKPRQAVADARAAVRTEPRDARRLFNAARVLCQAAACADAAPTAPGGGPVIAAQYRDEALTFLQRCLNHLPTADRSRFWNQVVRTDQALGPIRHARKFLDLDAEFLRAAGLASRNGDLQP
jgi:tetratricopeptide (TPR) repeat protein/tRNA A-37 threonylcarbamoyl transferase component Bud32